MWEQELALVKIVVVEPAGALNVGAIARVMKNFGLSQLILVNPQCDRTSEEARHMAVHAGDILAKATEVATLPEALQGCTRIIATTARDRQWDLLEPAQTVLPWLIEAPKQQSALVFGPESRGLSNEELKFAQRFARIPSSPNYASLNLAQAVAICCYELAQAVDLPQSDRPSKPNNYASFEELEGYYQHLQAVLLKIGYLYPHTAASRMEKFRQIYNRAYLDKQELGAIRGILTQIEWALRAAETKE